jgi:hypothetical protein
MMCAGIRGCVGERRGGDGCGGGKGEGRRRRRVRRRRRRRGGLDAREQMSD